MKLLVLTPTLGASRFLDETVASVAALAVSKRHVLICPLAAQAELTQRFPEIVTDAGAGIYTALNRGLAVEGEWDVFTWINDDDLLLAEGVEQALAALLEDQSADIVYGRVNYIDVFGRSLGPLPVCRRPRSLAGFFSAGIPAITQHGTLVRRRLVERLGGFDARFALAGDFDYWARAIALSASFRYVPELMGYYRLRSGQLSNDLEKVRREIMASAEKHFAAPSTLRRGWLKLSFRLGHLPDLFRRFVHTGCWRSSDLYRGAATSKTNRPTAS